MTWVGQPARVTRAFCFQDKISPGRTLIPVEWRIVAGTRARCAFCRRALEKNKLANHFLARCTQPARWHRGNADANAWRQRCARTSCTTYAGRHRLGVPVLMARKGAPRAASSGRTVSRSPRARAMPGNGSRIPRVDREADPIGKPRAHAARSRLVAAFEGGALGAGDKLAAIDALPGRAGRAPEPVPGRPQAARRGRAPGRCRIARDIRCRFRRPRSQDRSASAVARELDGVRATRWHAPQLPGRLHRCVRRPPAGSIRRADTAGEAACG